MGQATDYNKLTLEIWTDGSIAPQDALATAGLVGLVIGLVWG